MTASVSQASGPAVQVWAGGAPQAQRAGRASGFDRLLETPARNHGNGEEKSPKVTGAGPHDHERGEAHDLRDAADALACEVTARADRAAAAQPDLDEGDTPQFDLPDERDDGGDEQAALSTRIRAEQTISALMAMTPAARGSQAAAPNGGTAAASGEARWPRSAALTALTQKSHADARALAAVTGDAAPAAEESAADAGAIIDTPAGARAAKAAVAKGAAPVVDALAAADAGAAVSPAPPRAGKARSEGDSRDGSGGNARKPAPVAGAASLPETARAAAPGIRASGGDDTGDEPDIADGDDGGKASAGARRGDQQPAAGKVSVIGQQAAPAPAALQLGVNASAVVAAIAGERGLHSAGASALQSALAFRDAQPMRSLKIEMHPAELGTVTVNLRTSGGQMSVELRVENHDAYERLSADSDAIVQSLRSLGYDIDRVSIQQPQAAATTVARAEHNAAGGGFSRDASSFQSGSSGNGSERSAGQNNGQGSRNDGGRHDQPREMGQDRAGGSLYI
jgi:hypothetical protein